MLDLEQVRVTITPAHDGPEPTFKYRAEIAAHTEFTVGHHAHIDDQRRAKPLFPLDARRALHAYIYGDVLGAVRELHARAMDGCGNPTDAERINAAMEKVIDLLKRPTK